MLREAELVALEVRRGLVSANGARDYGVCLTADSQVDAAATEALREAMRGSRAPLGLFDRGPDIATLRERCLAETGLPAPRQPVWPGHIRAAAA